MRNLFNSFVDKLLSFLCVVFILLWTVGVTIFVFPFYCFKNRDKIKSLKTEEIDDPKPQSVKKQTRR